MSKQIQILCFVAAGFCFSNCTHAQVTFTVTFNEAAGAFTTTEKNNITAHVIEAGQTWIRVMSLSGPRSIEVNVASNTSIPTANGSSVTSSFVLNTAGRDVFEQGMAGELRTGTDPNGASLDVQFNFGLNYLRNELWFDPNPAARSAPVPIDKTDAMSVFLHEFGHAIAYNGWANLANGQPPAGFWSVFDRWMIPGSPVLFNGTNSVAAWGSPPDLTINNIFHWGNSDRRPPMILETEKPVQWVDGRPKPRVVHGLESELMRSNDIQPHQTQGNLISELMNGVVFNRGTRYYISNLDLAVLKDAGFTVVNLPLFANGFE